MLLVIPWTLKLRSKKKLLANFMYIYSSEKEVGVGIIELNKIFNMTITK